MLKKISILLVIVLFLICSVFLVPWSEEYSVEKIIKPNIIQLKKQKIILSDVYGFDDYYSPNNSLIAKELNITETEAFLMGNIAKQWAESLLGKRNVYLKENDIIFNHSSYKKRFINSGFCLKNNKPCFQSGFDFQLDKIRKANYKVLEMNTDKIYAPDNPEVKNLKDFIVIRNSHIPKYLKNKKKKQKQKNLNRPNLKYENNFYKVILTDLTSKIIPDRNCDTLMCKEILSEINNSTNTIDMAIYGYSRVPKIEHALISAQKRGVKIRLVYDSDKNGKNIYEDTQNLTKIIKNNSSDKNSPEANNIMHDKFYIFDNKTVITGSANLSFTDMSGFNSNVIIKINSKNIAQIYLNEFEQMFSGKFHNEKIKLNKNSYENIEVFFSPKDKISSNIILPIINNAKNYIYIPTFLITESKIADALVNAAKRGVDVKIIADALNASAKHTKHNYLRKNNVLVKTENYAGKMHSKSMITDDKYTIIGSMNFSYSGENKNDENVILIKDSELTKFYKKFFLYQWSIIDDKWLKYNARAEGKDSIGSCFDGIDNNYDGLIDKEDAACK